DSHKEELCKELDRLINELMRAEEKYLPLIKHGYPVKYIFTQSRQSILQLKKKFKTFTQHQLSLTQTILYKRVLAEKEKVATTIKNLCEEVANLKNELIKNNKQIALLTERYKKLLDTHKSLLKNHTTLKDDYDALLENNSDYYMIDSIWDCFSNKILLVVYTNIDYSQIYDLNPLLELNIGTSREKNQGQAFQSGYGEERTF
ncbi:43385_t:CDS:2, partial [Gigaspora margarita]